MNNSLILCINIVFILILNYSCTSKIEKKISQESGYETSKYIDTKILMVNNLDSCSPGFEYFEDDESIAINAITILDSLCFLLDPYHRNIKMINLITGNIDCSDPSLISHRPYGIFTFQNFIYILTKSNTNYIFNTELEKISEFYLPLGLNYLIAVESEALKLYNPLFSSVSTINIRGDIIEEKKENINYLKYINGKKFEIVNSENTSIIKNIYGEFDLKRNFPYTWKYYDSFNLDFDENNIVYFSSNPDSLVIYVHNIKPKN